MLCTLIGAIILFINIQVGLDMHLYDDIGDASSSLRGSTSSLIWQKWQTLKVDVKYLLVYHFIMFDYNLGCPIYQYNTVIKLSAN